MKIHFLIAPMLCVAGCVSQGNPGPAPASRDKAPDRILIEARLMEHGVAFSSPRAVTPDGQEVRIEIGQRIDVPGLAQPISTGVALAVLPRIHGGRISFAGTCEVKRRSGDLNQPGFQAASFHIREAYFAGVVNSGEERLVKLEQPAGPPITLSLKFVVMVNTASLHAPR